MHDIFGNIIAETDGGGPTGATGTVREYIYLPEAEIAPTEGATAQVERPIAVVEAVNTASSVTWFVHVDHLNRPVRMTDAAKASVWDAQWLPWGGVHSITGSATLDARFPGQWFQSETGLHYNWHRSYDASIGRYTQPDPLGFVDGPSVYGYARGGPQSAVDPDGLNVGALCAPAGPLGVITCSAVLPKIGKEVIKYCLKSWKPADPGNCSPEEHRDLQNRADNACGPSRCVQADDQVALNHKISNHSSCITAQKRLNDKCYGGGNSGHQKTVSDRILAIAKCNEYFKHFGGVK